MPLVLDGALRREVAGVVDILQFSEYISARQYIHGNGNNVAAPPWVHNFLEGVGAGLPRHIHCRTRTANKITRPAAALDALGALLRFSISSIFMCALPRSRLHGRGASVDFLFLRARFYGALLRCRCLL